MGIIFQRLGELGMKEQDIKNCQESAKLVNGFKELFEFIKGNDIIVASDSNTLFIKWILDHN
jgi:hypothetical protein